MNATASNIKQRLSLRKPLQESLDILAGLADILELNKEVDLTSESQNVRALYPTCTAFERDFVSICYSIATGVGKTRLMGACVTYLYLEKGIRNFFILAPNLTIYNKLIEDFSNASAPKYVFNGISEFVHNKPVVITGDNYSQASTLFSNTEVRINIFNISKFNSESRGTRQGGVAKPPRIKRLSEYLGQSYWDYLSKLDDLVILMDEAHRYHADQSRNAINELKPILGIELTATPIADDGSQFRNVVYEYSLAQALSDGLYVKNPTIATRKDFDPKGRSDEEIEKIKLEDAISIHEDTKQELKLYSLNNNKRLVKPFVLVVCRDIAHAREVYSLINSKDFYNGDYTDKVLQIDSTTRNEEQIEQQFITLEQEDNEIEVVIHVNMLKEGWDVANLYTIVPLRAANASILVEQTIGRGLRLPYNGERTGVEKIDKLTVVAHDNFHRVITAAQDPNSILNKLKFVEIDEADLAGRTVVVTSQTTITQQIKKEQEEVDKIVEPEKKQQKQNQVDAKKILVTVIPSFNTNTAVKNVDDLKKPEVKQQVIAAVKRELSTGQLNVFAESIVTEAEAIYETMVNDYKNNTIEIPRMDLVQGEVTASFKEFDLDTADIHFDPLNEEIVVVGLKDNSYDTIDVRPGVDYGHPGKLLISELINFSEVDYDTNAALLHKLAKQALDRIEDQLADKADLRKTIFQWRKIIANKIYDQMMQHFQLNEPEYIKPNVRPFTRIEDWNFTALRNAGYKDYRDETFPAVDVPKYVFRGFEKACHFEYKFDSRTEQTISYILENDKAVLKWLRPAPNQFRIYWSHNSKLYEPDFIVETEDTIYMLEAKALKDLNAAEVIEKANAACKYCAYATEFTQVNKGKPWKYALIPHDQVSKTKSFAGIVSPNIKC
ncbi:restriction endonuclease subunit R [Segetibacter sp. 3557_3]|uniref:DEAD/DEAH box helicase family protein n=1 Tax=Segetibacter sp. 3557_3 TaxID=2547429 RepID=UPI001058F856|nr:DEAD/DEAH box helicase family protein [Segetibacter sp. 3557_3]TDH23966.1 restriction endonuclease subunit R [Segetibacter sp. 3557_3]